MYAINIYKLPEESRLHGTGHGQACKDPGLRHRHLGNPGFSLLKTKGKNMTMDHDVGLNLSLPMSTQPNDVVVTPPKMPKRTEIHGISWNWIDLRIQYIYIYMYIDYIDIHRYRSTVLLFGIPNGGFTRYLPLLSPMVPPAPPEA
jgi:hypothetical protein